MPKIDEKKLNPNITSVEIGTRTLRDVTIYPLSLADQFKLSDIITKAAQEYFLSGEERSDEQLISVILKVIEENIEQLLCLITGEDIEFAKEMIGDTTNLQASEIVLSIYDTNYGSAIKNVMSLVEKVKTILPSTGQLQQSVKDTLPTG